MCSDCEPLIKAIDAFLQKADNNLSGELTSEGYASGKKTVKAINKLEDGIADVLQEETKYITNEVRKADSLQDFSVNRWASVKQVDDTSEKLSRTFRDEFTEFMPGIIENYLQQTDRELHLDSISKVTTAWIRDWSGQLGELMKLTSHDEIENILVDGLEKGIGIPEFTQQIMDSGIRDVQYRARATALTEVLRAHSVAQQEAFSQSPSVTKKMWRHTGSYRNTPRPNHVDMDGQIVYTEDSFVMEGIYGGVYYPMYPRDPNLPPEESINCHCLAQPVVDEDILGLSLEERQELQRQAVDELNEEWEQEHPNEEPPETQEEAEPEEEELDENTQYVMDALKGNNVEYLEVKDLDKPLSSSEIVAKLSGGDETNGSCSSLALAYIANENGMDVTDYRGGSSCATFCKSNVISRIAQMPGVSGSVIYDKNPLKATENLIKDTVVEGKSYYLASGEHAAVIRKTGTKYQYMELQAPEAKYNGWQTLTTSELKERFGVTKSKSIAGIKVESRVTMIEGESLAKSKHYKEIMGYLNTNSGSQKKGSGGSVK